MGHPSCCVAVSFIFVVELQFIIYIYVCVCDENYGGFYYVFLYIYIYIYIYAFIAWCVACHCERTTHVGVRLIVLVLFHSVVEVKFLACVLHVTHCFGIRIV